MVKWDDLVRGVVIYYVFIGAMIALVPIERLLPFGDFAEYLRLTWLVLHYTTGVAAWWSGAFTILRTLVWTSFISSLMFVMLAPINWAGVIFSITVLSVILVKTLYVINEINRGELHD